MPSSRIIRVDADWECWPTWLLVDGDLANVAPESLPISAGLARDLNRWADDLDATYDADNPLESGFRTEQEQNAFEERGRELARRLQEELGGTAEVVYRR